MTDLEIKGVLFFSTQEHPEITGYLTVADQHFELAGWRASPIRAEITGRPIRSEQGGSDFVLTSKPDAG